jgi:hypothetical protein
MNADSTQLSQLGEQWRTSCQLYPLYAALAREFVLETPVCADLESRVEGPSEEAIRQAIAWFDTMDERIQVHQLRQFLQTTSLADSENLRAMLVHFLGKPKRGAADRDKIDFLLVQFFSLSTPTRLEDKDCDLAALAQVLEPILGSVEAKTPEWLAPLDAIIESANRCRRLSELFSGHLLEQGRKLKVQVADRYFQPSAMLTFARFNFLIRRVFFRLMHEDLNAILDGLRELENRGISILDCRRAHFSHQEPTDRLRMICHSWKVMFHAEYSSGQPLKMLADLRTVVEEALGRSASSAAPLSERPVNAGAKVAAAAATRSGNPPSAGQPSRGRAATKSTAGTSEAQEFDILGGSGHEQGEIL